jgi:Domain of unknown function (DUF6438)
MRLALVFLALAACDAGEPAPAHPAENVAPAPPPAPAVVVTLERQACYGRCPIYTITIHGDGRVDYHGEHFVKVHGDNHAQLTQAQLADLDRAFAKADYFALADEYAGYDVTDMPTSITSYTHDGRTKTIKHYHGDQKAPQALYDLEAAIDQIAGTDRWIGTKAEREQNVDSWQ